MSGGSVIGGARIMMGSIKLILVVLQELKRFVIDGRDALFSQWGVSS